MAKGSEWDQQTENAASIARTSTSYEVLSEQHCSTLFLLLFGSCGSHCTERATASLREPPRAIRFDTVFLGSTQY